MVWTEDKRKEENPDNKCFCRIFIRLRNKKISESDFCFIENFVSTEKRSARISMRQRAKEISKSDKMKNAGKFIEKRIVLNNLRKERQNL